MVLWCFWLVDRVFLIEKVGLMFWGFPNCCWGVLLLLFFRLEKRGAMGTKGAVWGFDVSCEAVWC